MTKAELRRELLARRLKLSDEEANRLSSRIAAKFVQSFDLSQVQCLHVYLPLLRKREIDTYLLVEEIRRKYPHINVVVPKADAVACSLESYRFTPDTRIENNLWEIPEPAAGTHTAPRLIDLIILPLLAFDRRGYRVGYGKGFYDRYLTRCRPGVLKTGLSFFGPVEAIHDIHLLDIRMDYCVTPDALYEFSRSG